MAVRVGQGAPGRDPGRAAADARAGGQGHAGGDDQEELLIRILSVLTMLGVDLVYYHLVSTIISLCLTPEVVSRWESFSLTYTTARWFCIFHFAF